ncbi:MAG: VWA domain-containing protein [bacterium]
MFFRFADPQFLLLLALIPLLGYWYFRRHRRRGATLRFSDLGVVKAVQRPSAARARHILFVLRMLIVGLLIVAFARPQSGMKSEEVITQGIDIVLAVDISSSMLAEDIQPNRVEAAKQVAAEFVKGRKNDRIGMVVFSGEAYTQCPLTLDYGILLNFLDEVHVGMIEDGTAIGMGLATAVNRLRTSEAKSKVIILLTDGRNNRGEIDPLTAAQAAQAFDVRIYTVGAGARGTAMYPVNDPFFGKRYVPIQVDIDDGLLTKIADMTGAKYFRATDRKSLEAVYKEIDAMEKTEIKVKEYTRYSELFFYLVGAAVILFLGEIGLAHTRFRKIP